MEDQNTTQSPNAPDTLRVLCTNENAPVMLDGRYYAAHPAGDGRVSEPMPRAAAERLATIPGFAIATLEADAEAAVDEAIAALKASGDADESPAQRTIAELNAAIEAQSEANRNMAAELRQVRDERDELQRKANVTPVGSQAELERQLASARQDTEAARAQVAALTEDVATLRASNERLAAGGGDGGNPTETAALKAQVADLTEQKAALEEKVATLTAQVTELEEQLSDPAGDTPPKGKGTAKAK